MSGALADSDAFYDDDELFYDAPLGLRKHMSKIACNIDRLPPVGVSAKLDKALKAITAKPTTFTDATDVLADGGTVLAALKAEIKKVDDLSAELKSAREARDQKSEAAEKFYKTDLKKYVEDIADGDASIILLADMEVAGGAGPVPAMTKVMNLVLTAGEAEGTTAAKWDTMTGTRWYEVQVSLGNPNESGTWSTYDSTNEIDMAINGQPSGSKLWCRVRACRAGSKGAWSDPACVTVP